MLKAIFPFHLWAPGQYSCILYSTCQSAHVDNHSYLPDVMLDAVCVLPLENPLAWTGAYPVALGWLFELCVCELGPGGAEVVAVAFFVCVLFILRFIRSSCTASLIPSSHSSSSGLLSAAKTCWPVDQKMRTFLKCMIGFCLCGYIMHLFNEKVYLTEWWIQTRRDESCLPRIAGFLSSRVVESSSCQSGTALNFRQCNTRCAPLPRV